MAHPQERGPLPPRIGHGIVQMLDDAFCYPLIMQQACRGRQESAFHYSQGCCSRRPHLVLLLEEECHRAADGFRGARMPLLCGAEV